MPRFFFDIHLRHGTIADPEGSELPDLPTAEREALVSLRQILGDLLRGSGPVEVQQIKIANGAGQVLAAVQLEDAIRNVR